jgi:leucyl-tRNA synthetase
LIGDGGWMGVFDTRADTIMGVTSAPKKSTHPAATHAVGLNRAAIAAFIASCKGRSGTN